MKIIVYIVFAILSLQGIATGRDLQQAKKVSNPCINLAGYEWLDRSIFPTTQEVDYFFSKGLRTIRLPLAWERLQPSLNGPFDANYYNQYTSLCNYAVTKGGTCIIDVHSYGQYNKVRITANGSPSIANFKNLWTQLANNPSWKSNDRVWFSLMNEPYGFVTQDVRNFMQAGIDAVRATGAKNWVVVNGNGYSGSYSWVNDAWYGTPNAQVFGGLNDGGVRKIIIDTHNYLDSDNSGQHTQCVSTSIGVDRLTAFIAWCRSNGYKAAILETGTSTDATCLSGLNNMLSYLSNNNDVVMSWCWWAGGRVWDPNYISLLDPANGQDKPQMSVIQRYV